MLSVPRVAPVSIATVRAAVMRRRKFAVAPREPSAVPGEPPVQLPQCDQLAVPLAVGDDVLEVAAVAGARVIDGDRDAQVRRGGLEPEADGADGGELRVRVEV